MKILVPRRPEIEIENEISGVEHKEEQDEVLNPKSGESHGLEVKDMLPRNENKGLSTVDI